ncbi:brain and acute leukemia cytoplasmic protein [Poecilia reticulata]|uniref:brain and acute leukemia cytoplasmic protein n=1 Tax=Poecilia reticulata TaxID=8081 RepID=UPI0004A4E0CF|nr:PREDICTED: brain and acute leukemia cytoplasmic protein-like [Poecilia reticulata]
MVFSMGCGGSRADAIIEPRYHESWTRETESTWLTNTDVEPPVSVPNSKAVEAGLKEKRMVTTGTQCGKQAITANGSNHQRRPRRSLTDGQCCEKQSTRDSKRRASKEASALSKDGQPVGVNSPGDPEPETACDER